MRRSMQRFLLGVQGCFLLFFLGSRLLLYGQDNSTNHLSSISSAVKNSLNANTSIPSIPIPPKAGLQQTTTSSTSSSNYNPTHNFSSNVDYAAFSTQYLLATPFPGYESRVVPAGWEEAYVGFFFGKKYVPLMEVVIDAVHTFSDRPIALYVAGDSIEEIRSILPPAWKDRYAHLIVYFMPKSPMKPWFDKLRAILLSNVERGIIVEADTIITPSANSYFKLLDQLPPTSLSILAPQHPDWMATNRSECPHPRACGGTFPYPMEKRAGRGQYRHAHIMWTARSKFFFEDIMKECVGSTSWQCDSDESAVNTAIWDSTIPVHELCVMDPYYSQWTRLYFEGHMKQQAATIQDMYGPRTLAFSFMHGCKNPTEAADLLKRLKTLYGQEWKEVFENQQKHLVPWILQNGSMKTAKDVKYITTGLTGKECLLLPMDSKQ